jgi:predicted lactoylglutathione lyase/quercetin dioxygenase-like cupin family protein
VVPLDALSRDGVARFEGLLDGGPSRPDLSLFAVRTAPGGGSTRHVHPYPEVFLLLQGDAEYEVGTTTVRPGPGSVVVVPPGAPHRYRNVGDAPLLQVSIHPAGTVAQRDVPAPVTPPTVPRGTAPTASPPDPRIPYPHPTTRHVTVVRDDGRPRRPPMPRMIFFNLPVRDAQESRAFYEALGFGVNEDFSDEQTACVVVDERIMVMLLDEAKFRTFIKNEIAPRDTTETTLALSCESRDEVIELAGRAKAAGAGAWNDPMDMGFMYGESFRDPDGHVWELMWMDAAAAAGAMADDGPTA